MPLLPSMRPSVCAALLLAACYSPQASREWADRAAYGILQESFVRVTGAKREFVVERRVDSLRRKLLTSRQPVRLSLTDALDVAAENSRDFQRQKEILFLSALTLTGVVNDFSWRFGGGGGGTTTGTGGDTATGNLSDDLSAAANSTAGTSVMASFAQTFMRSILSGGNFDGSSIMNLTLTQPLLRGAGRKIAREPLTQAERNVIYAMRTFERFRAQFATDIVSTYWSNAQLASNLRNVEANYEALKTSREQIEALFNSGRKTIVDLGRAKQAEYNADAARVTALNQLQTQLDQFKLTLGVPMTAQLELDSEELERLRGLGVTPIDIKEEDAIALALERRYDYRTTVDQVEDAGRRVVIAENGLQMGVDFTSSVNVPAEGNSNGPNFDWSKVRWSAGLDIDLMLNRVPARNSYRSTLITFDQTLRAREQAEDQLTQSVRLALRNIRTQIRNYNIQNTAVELAEQRVQATRELYDAGRVQAFDLLDAQNSLVSAQLSRNAAIVSYSQAKLTLLNNLEGVRLEPQGLHFDQSLPIPTFATAE